MLNNPASILSDTHHPLTRTKPPAEVDDRVFLSYSTEMTLPPCLAMNPARTSGTGGLPSATGNSQPMPLEVGGGGEDTEGDPEGGVVSGVCESTVYLVARTK